MLKVVVFISTTLPYSEFCITESLCFSNLDIRSSSFLMLHAEEVFRVACVVNTWTTQSDKVHLKSLLQLQLVRAS